MNHAASQLYEALDNKEDISPSFKKMVLSCVKGGEIAAAELVQVKRDLGKTKYAQEISRRRRANKNRSIQAGGVLKVADARSMVQKRADDDIQAAYKKVEKATQQLRNKAKRCGVDAGRLANKWRKEGRLKPFEVLKPGHRKYGIQPVDQVVV